MLWCRITDVSIAITPHYLCVMYTDHSDGPWRGGALSPPPRPRLCCYFKAVIHNVVECILFKFQSLFFPPFHSPFHIELLILLSLQCNYYNNIRCIIVDVRIFQLCGCNVSRCTDDFNWSHFCLRTCNIYCTSHAMMYLAFYSSRLVFFNLMQDSILFFTMDVCWQIFIDCMLVCWSFFFFLFSEGSFLSSKY